MKIDIQKLLNGKFLDKFQINLLKYDIMLVEDLKNVILSKEILQNVKKTVI